MAGQMAVARLAVLYFSAASYLETLGRPFVSLLFGHAAFPN
jgi:hypothetical protein